MGEGVCFYTVEKQIQSELLGFKAITTKEDRRNCRAHMGCTWKNVQQRKVIINIWQWSPCDFKCTLSVIH